MLIYIVLMMLIEYSDIEYCFLSITTYQQNALGNCLKVFYKLKRNESDYVSVSYTLIYEGRSKACVLVTWCTLVS